MQRDFRVVRGAIGSHAPHRRLTLYTESYLRRAEVVNRTEDRVPSLLNGTSTHWRPSIVSPGQRHLLLMLLDPVIDVLEESAVLRLMDPSGVSGRLLLGVSFQMGRQLPTTSEVRIGPPLASNSSIDVELNAPDH